MTATVVQAVPWMLARAPSDAPTPLGGTRPGNSSLGHGADPLSTPPYDATRPLARGETAMPSATTPRLPASAVLLRGSEPAAARPST